MNHRKEKVRSRRERKRTKKRLHSAHQFLMNEFEAHSSLNLFRKTWSQFSLHFYFSRALLDVISKSLTLYLKCRFETNVTKCRMCTNFTTELYNSFVACTRHLTCMSNAEKMFIVVSTDDHCYNYMRFNENASFNFKSFQNFWFRRYFRSPLIRLW